MADQPIGPPRITGREFLKALRDLDVVRDFEYARRVVIDAHMDRVLQIYVERIGDKRALGVAPLVAGGYDFDAATGPAEGFTSEAALAAVEAEPLDAPALSDSARKDFDETRRLLYMGTVVNRTKKYNLAGTLINALKHHQKTDLPVDELTDRVVDLVEGDGTEWAYAEIERICDALGE